MDPSLTINQLSKTYEDNSVLEDINLTINKGEIFGLVGLNGVGKTTLIKLVLNMQEADKGEVLFQGKDICDSQTRENLSYFPEKLFPSPFLTGHEFLSLTLAHYQDAYDKEKASALCERLYLNTDHLDKKIHHYSLGMMQKLGLISTFLSQAPFLILDEPMNGLDPQARIALKELMLDYQSQGNTIFFSSHILSDIDEMCHKIAILHDKSIGYVGSPSELKTKHSNQMLEQAFLIEIS